MMDLFNFLKTTVSADLNEIVKLVEEEIKDVEKEFELAAEKEDIYNIGYCVGKISGLKISKLFAEIMLRTKEGGRDDN